MKLHVKHDESCDYHNVFEDDDIDYSWESGFTHTIFGVYKKKPKDSSIDNHRYETFTVDFEAKRGDHVYVVTLVYSAGDSFGTAYGKHEVVWVFSDHDLAERLKTKLQRGQHDETMSVKTESGKKVKMSNPVAGYFESLMSIEIDTFVIQ